MFLSFIKGDKVQEWTQEQLRWAVDYVAQAIGNDNHKYLWNTVSNAFFRAFTNITREVDAQTDIKTLKMKGDHGLDDYISSFERLARLGGYNLNDQAVVDMFIDGLPASLAINVAKFNNPADFDDWKQWAVEHHTKYLWIKSKFHSKGQGNTRPTQDQWKRHSQKRGTTLWTLHRDESRLAPPTRVHPLTMKNASVSGRKGNALGVKNRDT